MCDGVGVGGVVASSFRLFVSCCDVAVAVVFWRVVVVVRWWWNEVVKRGGGGGRGWWWKGVVVVRGRWRRCDGMTWRRRSMVSHGGGVSTRRGVGGGMGCGGWWNG